MVIQFKNKASFLKSKITALMISATTLVAALSTPAQAGPGGTILEIVVYDMQTDSSGLISILDTMMGKEEFEKLNKFDLNEWGLPGYGGGGTQPTDAPSDECSKLLDAAQRISSSVRGIDQFLAQRGVSNSLRSGVTEKIFTELGRQQSGMLQSQVTSFLDVAARQGKLDMNQYKADIRPEVRDRIRSEQSTRDLTDRVEEALEALADCKRTLQ